MKYLYLPILFSMVLVSGAFSGQTTAAKQTEAQKKAACRAEMIKKYDKDGDGKLSKEERIALQKDRHAKMVKQFDTDGDGKLSKAERTAMRETMKKNREGKCAANKAKRTQNRKKGNGKRNAKAK